MAERFLGYANSTQGSFLKHLYTLLVVNFAWVLFRADDLYQAGRFLMNMLGVNNNGFYSSYAVMFLRENWLFFLAGILFCTPIARQTNQWLFQGPRTLGSRIVSIAYPAAMLLLFAVCVSYLAGGTYNPFIYFNF